MGCNDSRKGYSQEELALEAREAELRFNKLSCESLLRSFTWYAQGPTLTRHALIDAATELGLEIQSLPGTADISAFYEGLKQSEHHYSLHKLQVLSILLGAGYLDVKAKALFKLYDPQDELTLGTTVVEQMCEDLVNASIEDIGRLDASTRIKDYISGLAKVRDEFIREMTGKIMNGGTIVSQEAFLKTMTSPDASHYLSSSSLRVAIAGYKRQYSIQKFPKNVSLLNPPQGAKK